ncbi:hypothetical protein FRAAL2770 [Frankia alni ACN14a]|uniref:Uncharacterized protein n=1 Tax=Frankia alni (strain DSM 45986 / CECT 9034 / ACN14a) TaxID=326424 RepID=Q0RM38_FRAAA|nr:hypothetical protein FRAAL2770 [Frankia alni ACN14a]
MTGGAPDTPLTHDELRALIGHAVMYQGSLQDEHGVWMLDGRCVCRRCVYRLGKDSRWGLRDMFGGLRCVRAQSLARVPEGKPIRIEVRALVSARLARQERERRLPPPNLKNLGPPPTPGSIGSPDR